MRLKQLLLSCIVFFFVAINAFSQDQKQPLWQKSYDQILTHYTKANKKGDTLQVIHSGEALVKKGKKEGPVARLILGYRILSVFHLDERVLSYSDSIIFLTKDNSDVNYPALAYEVKGDFYAKKEVFKRAIDSYLKFYEYAKKHNQELLVFRANYAIASLKRRTGNLDEALELFRKNFSYAQENLASYTADNSYLNAIFAMASILNDQKKVDSASYYNAYGLKESKRLEKDYYSNLFALNEGLILFNKKEYVSAIDRLKKHTPYFETIKDQLQLPMGYFYTGESYRLLKEDEKAIPYYKKIDSIFEQTQSLFPNVKESYIRLLNYYDKIGDSDSKAHYAMQKMKVDSIVNANELYVSEGIVKNYDFPKIEETQKIERIQSQAKEESYQNLILILTGFVLLLVIGFFVQYKKRQVYKKRFDAIVQNKEEPSSSEHTTPTESSIHVPQEVIDMVLAGLQKFEEECEFTSNEITLSFLAKKFNTNANYLSKVINHFKGTSFSTYVNNLRIDYCVAQLKTDSSYQKYTIKAISYEMGFNNVQSFTKAFYKSKGINPSFFLKELRKMES
jgi:YesN/AraC family two-component response regulator